MIGMEGIKSELDNIGIEHFSLQVRLTAHSLLHLLTRLQDDRPLFEDSDLLQYKPDDQVIQTLAIDLSDCALGIVIMTLP